MSKKEKKIVTFAEQDRKKYIKNTFSTVFVVACFFCITQPLFDIPAAFLFRSVSDSTALNCLKIILTYLYKGIGIYMPFLIYNIIKTKKTGAFFHKKSNARLYHYLIAIPAVAGIAVGIQYASTFIVSNMRSLGYVVTEFVPDIADNTVSCIVFIVAATFIPALFEELTFRGILMQNLMQDIGSWSIAISAIVCTLSHISLQQMPYVFVVNIFIAWLYYKTRSLWLTYAVNAVANGSIAFFYVMSLKNSMWYTSCMSFVAIICGIVGTAFAVILICTVSAIKSDSYNFTIAECAKGFFTSFFLWVLVIASFFRLSIGIVKPDPDSNLPPDNGLFESSVPESISEPTVSD